MGYRFRDHLAAWGPHRAGSKTASRADSRSYCRRLTGAHYENFFVTSILLPRDLRVHFDRVYSFCRWADDLSDEVESAAESSRLLDWWESELDQCTDGKVWHPVFVGLRETIAEFQIPRTLFRRLIQAFRRDQTNCEYETFADLLGYCSGSANPVGRIVLHLFRSASEENMVWSDSICTGLQLANFWQDVHRDAMIDRSYLPREDCARFGYTDAMRTAHVENREFRQLMAFQVDRASEYLLNGLPLAHAVAPRFRASIDLFIQGGLAILDQIRAIDYGVWQTRPVIRKPRALRLLFSAVLRSWMSRFRR